MRAKQGEVERLRRLATTVDIYLYAQTELGQDPEGALRDALTAATDQDSQP